MNIHTLLTPLLLLLLPGTCYMTGPATNQLDPKLTPHRAPMRLQCPVQPLVWLVLRSSAPMAMPKAPAAPSDDQRDLPDYYIHYIYLLCGSSVAKILYNYI